MSQIEGVTPSQSPQSSWARELFNLGMGVVEAKYLRKYDQEYDEPLRVIEPVPANRDSPEEPSIPSGGFSMSIPAINSNSLLWLLLLLGGALVLKKAL